MIKKSIISILIILSFLSVYLGAYRPLVKARLYISARQAAASFRSFEDLTARYDEVFNYYSPIGDKEIAKFFSTSVLNSTSNDGQSEEVAKLLAEYAISYIYQNDAVHLLQAAYIYDSLWQKFGDMEYYNAAEAYYSQIHEIGPRLPHALHGLFSLYLRSGEAEKAREIGMKILELWPQDERVKLAVEQL